MIRENHIRTTAKTYNYPAVISALVSQGFSQEAPVKQLQPGVVVAVSTEEVRLEERRMRGENEREERIRGRVWWVESG